MLNLHEQIVDRAVRLTRDSDRMVSHLNKVIKIGKYLAPQRGYRRQLQKLEYAIDHDHPALDLIRRIAEESWKTPVLSRKYQGALHKLS
ncbi:MAG: hypothetical protein R6V19_15970 [Armatimonadota bacterium]